MAFPLINKPTMERTTPDHSPSLHRTDEFIESLFKQIKEGHKAKEAVLESFVPLIRSLTTRACRELNIPSDYYADVLESVQFNILQGLEQFKGDKVAQFIEWVRAIARNAARGLRIELSKKWQREVDLDASIDEPCSRTPEEKIRSREAIVRLVRDLSAEERMILILHSINEHTFSEIAELLNIPRATVQRKYVAILQKLRKHSGGGQ